MKNNNTNKNMVMLALAAIALVAVNVGIWMASQKGIIPVVDNLPVWGAFVALNILSLLWAMSLLGLQPLVVSIAYVAGGFLAFHGVRGMSGINVAEVTSAGAVYGAFGALAVGNATAKVRLAFFNKGQVPFIFVIVGLLVVDGVLNSRVSQAGTPVLLNALAIPFVVAGVVVGSIWMVLNRVGIGRSAKAVENAAEAEAEEAVEATAVVAEKLVIQVPKKAAAVEEKPARVAAQKQQSKKQAPKKQAAKKKAAPKPAPQPRPVAKPAAKPAPAPKPAVAEKVAEPVKEEQFFPLEIDKDDTFILPADDQLLQVEATEPETFSVPSFDADNYSSGMGADKDSGGVMVKEPAVAKAPAAAKPAPVKEPVKAPEEKKEDANEDWLNGHLDLLNKL